MNYRIVVPTTKALADHAADVTARLREDEPPLGLLDSEAVCPVCTFAFIVRSRALVPNVCPDCHDDLVRVPA